MEMLQIREILGKIREYHIEYVKFKKYVWKPFHCLETSKTTASNCHPSPFIAPWPRSSENFLQISYQYLMTSAQNNNNSDGWRDRTTIYTLFISNIFFQRRCDKPKQMIYRHSFSTKGALSESVCDWQFKSKQYNSINNVAFL